MVCRLRGRHHAGPDSRLITELNVLPAGGDEATDAIALIRQEEETHGNDVAALSIDGAGFNGPMLRELEDPGCKRSALQR